MHSPINDIFLTLQTARKNWRDSSFKTRLSAIKRLSECLFQAIDEIVETLYEESGRTRTDCMTGDVMVTLEAIRFYHKHAEQWLSTEKRGNKEVHNVPYGIVAVFSPWNFPLQLSLIPACCALLAGNVVVLKPSEQMPRFNNLLKQLIIKAGFPPGVFEVVEGGPEVGKALIDNKPNKIFFTGSTETGKHIAHQAAEQLIPCELELGGKDAVVITADANLKQAARACVWGAFFNNGQACISVERVFVHATIYKPFLKQVLKETKKMERERDIGPLMNKEAYDNVYHQFVKALEEGAVCHTPEPDDPPYFPPTVLTNVTQEMAIMQEETFGPLLPIMTFQSDEEAVAMVNYCRYGLNASIFSRDIQKAKNLARQFETGNVLINDTVTNVSDMSLPFSGRKMSGYGISHGKEGLLAFTQPLSLTIKSARKTRRLNWFPYSEKGLFFIKSWVKFRQRS